MEYKGNFVQNQSPEKYVNHSCDANTFEKDFCDIALKNIKKGEEITSDYGGAKVSEPHFKCNCKSKKCKQQIKIY